MRRIAPVRWIAPAAIALAALAGSCTQIDTSPTIVTSLEFDSLPYPAIVTGDSLRDSLGVARPLHALAFNGAGGLIPNASITYLALDTGLTIGSTGFVTAQRRDGSVRLVASVPSLQSVSIHLLVARRPDSVGAVPPVVDTLRYATPDTPANVTGPLTLKVATRDTAGGITGTQGWLVSYQVVFRGKSVPITDTSVVSLWNAASKPSLIDTTAADGTVSPKLRVRSTLLALTESVTVVASVRYRGAPVPGSPVTYVIQLRPAIH